MGKRAIVDDADYEYLSQWKWSAYRGGRTFYARRHAVIGDGKTRLLYLHQAILNPKKGQYVSHENGNGLDNRRENIRATTQKENGKILRLSVRNKSGFRGVCWSKKDKVWVATVGGDKGRNIYLGCSKDKARAVRLRKDYDQKNGLRTVR